MTNPTPADVERLIADAEAVAIGLAMIPKQRKVAKLLADLIAALRAMQAENGILRTEKHADAEAIGDLQAKLAEVEKERDEYWRQASWQNMEHGKRISELRNAEAAVATLTAQVDAMRLSAMKAMTIANGALDSTATEKTFRRDLVQIREELRGALWPAALTTEKNDG